MAEAGKPRGRAKASQGKAASARPCRNPDVQRIWIHCDEREEADDLVECCRGSGRVRLHPEFVDLAGLGDWRNSLSFHVKGLPEAYGPGEWEEFLADAGALLSSSLANLAGQALRRRDRKACGDPPKARPPRWPALLVTDRPKLYAASMDPLARATLAEAGKLWERDLLPVVMSTDFGFLSGFLSKGPNVAVFRSLVLRECAQERGVSAPRAISVDVRPGVYIQRHTSGESSVMSTAHAEEEGRPSEGPPLLFGARCVALFSDGSGAYAAISPDGTRAVEARGRWEVINGYVVIGRAAGRLSHTSLSRRGSIPVNVAYDEPVFISLLDLVSEFQPPVELAECIPRGGERLRLSLSEDEAASQEANEGCNRVPKMHLPSHAESSPPRPSALSERASPPPLPLDRTDGTFGTDWDTTFGSSVTPAAARLSNSLSRTPVHALWSITSADQKAREPVEGVPGPRLFGLNRGVTVHAGAADWDRATEEAGGEGPAQGAPGLRRGTLEAPASPMLKRLTAFASATACQSAADAAKDFDANPLRLGSYSFAAGTAEGPLHKRIELTLRPDGSCKYFETAQGCTLRSVPKGATWRVKASDLVLEPFEAGRQAFVLRQTHGNRSVESLVAQARLPVEAVLRSCNHTPFPQQHNPFPGHTPRDASQRIFGMVDPDSPVLRGMKCRPDRLPYHAFQDALRRHGVPCDDIISDFGFLDRDEDGQVSVGDMRRLEEYGSPTAAPEVIHALREALVQTHGTPAAAFEALEANAGGSGKVTLSAFERFLSQAAAEANPKAKALKAWVDKTSEEERAVVFSSLNPNDSQAIDMADFMSLNLHTAVLALRRLDHFQSWLFDQFGRSEQVFSKVFSEIDVDQAGVVTRKTFAEGVRELGYPCGQESLRSMFSLLDRNFDGEVSRKDFQKLREFNAELVLKHLEALRRWVDEKLGGVDACYKKFQEREQHLQKTQSLPKSVSFEAVQKTCVHSGFSKVVPQADIKVLFLFIAEASGRRANGFLAQSQWDLLRCFRARALNGSPARLRKLLEEQYGSLDQAFQRMHTSWMKRALVKGLKQTALAGLARALCAGEGPADGAPPTVAEPSFVAALPTAEPPRPQLAGGGRCGPPARPRLPRPTRLGPPRPADRGADDAGGLPPQRPRTAPAAASGCVQQSGSELATLAAAAATAATGRDGWPAGTTGRGSGATSADPARCRHRLVSVLSARNSPTPGPGPVSAIDWRSF